MEEFRSGPSVEEWHCDMVVGIALGYGCHGVRNSSYAVFTPRSEGSCGAASGLDATCDGRPDFSPPPRAMDGVSRWALR